MSGDAVTGADWTETRRVFDEALARTEEDRDEFLRRRCDKDAALRRDVQTLLDADMRAGDGAFIRDAIRESAEYALTAERSRGTKPNSGPTS